VYLFEHETMAEAEERIGHFLEDVYNRKRLHLAIVYARGPSLSTRFDIRPLVNLLSHLRMHFWL
jgi:hypothetical protein